MYLLVSAACAIFVAGAAFGCALGWWLARPSATPTAEPNRTATTTTTTTTTTTITDAAAVPKRSDDYDIDAWTASFNEWSAIISHDEKVFHTTQCLTMKTFAKSRDTKNTKNVKWVRECKLCKRIRAKSE